MNNAEVIFKKLFKVKVPRITTMTQMELELYGGASEFTKDGDIRNANEDMVLVMLPPIKMMEYMQYGYRVDVPNVDDVVLIYKSIHDHIQHARNYQLKSINDIPIDPSDLAELDSFAQTIFENNKALIVKSQERLAAKFDVDLAKLFMSKKPAAEKPVLDFDQIEREQYKAPLGVGMRYQLSELLDKE